MLTPSTWSIAEGPSFTDNPSSPEAFCGRGRRWKVSPSTMDSVLNVDRSHRLKFCMREPYGAVDLLLVFSSIKPKA